MGGKSRKRSRKRDYDYSLKFVFAGQSNVGKTSLMIRLADDEFKGSYVPTIGVDFRYKSMEVDGKIVKFEIWDTAGQERFRTITSTYYKGASAIIIAYDVTKQETFDEI